MDEILIKIKILAEQTFGAQVIDIYKLPQSGSYRQYFRICMDNNNSCLGVFNTDQRENDAFVAFSKHFITKGLNVPKILAYYPSEKIYFVEYLGDTTLYDFLQKNSDKQIILNTYKKIIDKLIDFQTKAIEGIDLSFAYPRQDFDLQSILWDLNYFKYFVLRIAKVPFDEQKLENDFKNLADLLLSVNTNFFLYRDFQSKNIMLFEDEIYFIDYQGGRRGAAYYDLASLLFDSKANLQLEIRQDLLNYYYSKYAQIEAIDYKNFEKNFYNYVLIRILQASAAYCFRGLIEKKLPFVASLPFSIRNINFLLQNNLIDKSLVELIKAIDYYANKSWIADLFKDRQKVKIRINSFSYHKTGYPIDEHNNGGGFVFDCRFLPNPGALEQYKPFSGLDEPIINYFNSYPEVEKFIIESVFMVLDAINSFEDKQYENLQVNFGCTGGKHRSVYCAQKTYYLLKNIFNCNNVELRHLELEKINSHTK